MAGRTKNSRLKFVWDSPCLTYYEFDPLTQNKRLLSGTAYCTVCCRASVWVWHDILIELRVKAKIACFLLKLGPSVALSHVSLPYLGFETFSTVGHCRRANLLTSTNRARFVLTRFLLIRGSILHCCTPCLCQVTTVATAANALVSAPKPSPAGTKEMVVSTARTPVPPLPRRASMTMTTTCRRATRTRCRSIFRRVLRSVSETETANCKTTTRNAVSDSSYLPL